MTNVPPSTRVFVPPRYAESNSLLNRIHKRMRNGCPPCVRDVTLFEQVALLAGGGNVARFIPCTEGLAFCRPGLSAPAGDAQIVVPHPLSLGDTCWTQTWYFMQHRLGHVADQANWFSVGEGLALRLMTTELRGLTSTDVRLPFHTFAIELPKGLLSLSDPITGFHEARAIYVAECDSSHKPGAHIPGRHLMILVRCVANEKSSTPMEYLDLCFPISLLEGRGLDEQDAEPAARYRSLVEQRGLFLGCEVSTEQSRKLLVQFVLNTCLYLSSAHADIRHVHAEEIKRLSDGRNLKKARTSVRERVARLRRERVFLVGSSVRVDPVLREHLLRAPGTGSSLTYRTVVRGHWKHQVFGEGRVERRLIWIQPYVRGGEDLPEALIGHSYKVA